MNNPLRPLRFLTPRIISLARAGAAERAAFAYDFAVIVYRLSAFVAGHVESFEPIQKSKTDLRPRIDAIHIAPLCSCFVLTVRAHAQAVELDDGELWITAATGPNLQP